MENIGVSIVCNTYNHEKYIAKALDSFLMQKVNFKYEILVHDDASTDETANIVREYEKSNRNRRNHPGYFVQGQPAESGGSGRFGF